MAYHSEAVLVSSSGFVKGFEEIEPISISAGDQVTIKISSDESVSAASANIVLRT